MSFKMRSPLVLLALRIGVAGVPVAGILLMASTGACAQDAVSDVEPKQTVSIVPRISVVETLTNNVRLSSSDRKSELITEIGPGIKINSQAGRLKVYLDYALSEIVYANDSSPRRSQNALNTFGTLEAVDNWAYLDFSRAISQQSISAFGTPSIDNTTINANQTEVTSYRISPYLRGRLGNLASYEARYSRSGSRGDALAQSGVTRVESLLSLNGDSGGSKFGWSADASRQQIDYSAGRPTEADLLDLSLSYAVTPEFKLIVFGGQESNNYTTLDKKSYATHGLGFNWSPSETSDISAQTNRRSFGNTYSLVVEKRTARTVWRYSNSKDVSATPNQTGIASIGSVYDLLYRQFASLEPSPITRAALVNAYLRAYGISPDAVVFRSFLTSAVTLQRRQDLSLALLGVRDTIMLIATRSENSRLDMVSTGVDDFSSSSLIRQRGFIVNYAHRLTPEYSLAVLASQQHTSGLSSLQDIKLRSLNISVTGNVGKDAIASVAVRRVVSHGSAASYNESAILASLTVQF